MSRKLPLTRFAAPSSPTVDAVRRRLGGRAATERGAGEVVSVVTEGGVQKAGVVLFVRGDDLLVWIAEGIVRKAQRAEVTAATSAELEGLADAARSFGELLEGQRVSYQPEGGAIEEGTLVEKCRFGGLLLRNDGAVMGVGFRKIWPSRAASSTGPSGA